MDINPSKKSKLLYQKGDRKTRGVVDLRCFAEPTKRSIPLDRKGRTFYEIKAIKKYASAAKESYLRESAEPEPIETAFPQKARTEEAISAYRLSDAGETEKFLATEADQTQAIASGNIKDSVMEIAVSDKKNRVHALSLPSFKKISLSRTSFREFGPHQRKNFARFATSAFMIPVIIFSLTFTQSQFEKKGKVLGESTLAYENLKSAAQYAFASDFASTSGNFDAASLNFMEAQGTINSIGFGIGETIASLPINTPLSTGRNLASAGENLSLAGKDMSIILEKISGEEKEGFEKLTGLEESLRNAANHISEANENLKGVDIKYIPSEMQSKISFAKETLPDVSENFQRLAEDYPLIMKMLGGERSQKYLLLFENNSEMRATGGFIGSYGILDIENGKIRNLYIDGIFNPDGQLKEKIIPPMPIQKISASWSMHDSNWFADFPASAKKTALLYEKTGGPTVDGVIAITPETIKKMLEITGPIEMPQYGVTLTAENFISETQNQVENLYDKKENRPKKILSDLAPILLERIFEENPENGNRPQRLIKTIQKIEESLKEKHIIIYHRDEGVENMLQKRGWGGEIIQNAAGDYLAVINSNINGYKTDAVIEENIDLETEILEDGRIIDTLTIRRKHTGGNSSYDWYNRVNADFMRVYVPKGSILLEASGHTLEEYEPPMDYSTFKTDSDVAAVESTIKIDPDSGTQIFEEAGKTVFGNWVYVSPQEEVTVIYKYELPFKIDFASGSRSADLYSAIIQKQAGSIGSSFAAEIKFPEEWQIAWQTKNFQSAGKLEKKLDRDLIYGSIFIKK